MRKAKVTLQVQGMFCDKWPTGYSFLPYSNRVSTTFIIWFSFAFQPFFSNNRTPCSDGKHVHIHIDLYTA